MNVLVQPEPEQHEWQSLGGKVQLVGELVPYEGTRDGVDDLIHQKLPLLLVFDAGDQRGGVDEGIGHDDGLGGGRRLAQRAYPIYTEGVALVGKEDGFGDAHEVASVAPDSMEAGPLLRAVTSPQRLGVLDGAGGAKQEIE